MKISELLSETPIEDLNLIGNWDKNSSFRNSQDRKLISNPKAQEKIIQKWSNTSVPFNMYFVNASEVYKHSEVGEVSVEWLQKNMPKTFPQIKLSDNAVNIVFTGNNGAERVPMTAWIIAHRFGHVLRRPEKGISNWKASEKLGEAENILFRAIDQILTEIYSIKKPGTYDWENRKNFEGIERRFCEQIGTFKSAREKKLRNKYEFLYELLAQYIITGTIKFNPIPRSFGHGRMAWGKFTHQAYQRDGDEYANDILDQVASDLMNEFEAIMESCIGKIFVM